MLELAGRAGRAGHDLVGWLMWDPPAKEAYTALGVPEGAGWLVAWRLAALGDCSPAVAAAATYSIHPAWIEHVMFLYRDATDTESVMEVRNAAVLRGLEGIAPGLGETIGPFAHDLWRGVDSAHHGARPMFAAHRASPRPEGDPA
ncbi:MAG: helix-turn-helix domain-containing protein, partial [Microthrixaceae bacterium]